MVPLRLVAVAPRNDGVTSHPITVEEARMRFVVAPFIVAACLLTGPALAQVDSREGIALQNQIYQLRQQLQAMQDQMVRGGGSGSRPPAYALPPPQQSGGNELVAQLLTRVDALEEQ